MDFLDSYPYWKGCLSHLYSKSRIRIGVKISGWMVWYGMVVTARDIYSRVNIYNECE